MGSCLPEPPGLRTGTTPPMVRIRSSRRARASVAMLMPIDLATRLTSRISGIASAVSCRTRDRALSICGVARCTFPATSPSSSPPKRSHHEPREVTYQDSLGQAVEVGGVRGEGVVTGLHRQIERLGTACCRCPSRAPGKSEYSTGFFREHEGKHLPCLGVRGANGCHEDR